MVGTSLIEGFAVTVGVDVTRWKYEEIQKKRVI